MRLVDRLRVERAVLTLDTWIGDLPRRRRRDVRRELRADLLASAADVGAREAVRRLGPLRRLGLDYLDAEFGELRPRPNGLHGLAWGIAAGALLVTSMVAGSEAYSSGLRSAHAGAGTYGHRLAPWGPRYIETYPASGADPTIAWEFDGGMILLWLAVILVAVVVGGRSWRAIPAWWRHRAPSPA